MAERRVSTLELFFDLVFVFTITQVALIAEHHPSWTAVAQALVELAVIFWMYGGYAWLANTVGAQTQRQRVVLLVGMAAFLLVSLSVPRAFAEDGVAFGWSYLVLTLVHLAGFLLCDVAELAAAIRSIGTVNLLAAGCVLAAGYAGSPWHWPLWVAAVLLQWGRVVVVGAPSAFGLDIGHFAERHGLMIIIVLGESLVSVALAAQEQPVTVGLAVGVLCGLAAASAFWWCYFARDDEAAAEAFRRVPPARRATLALVGYDLPHLMMMAGIIGVAAGSRLSLPQLTHPTSLAAASLLAGGAAVYLAALAGFRIALRFAAPWSRALPAVLVLALIPVGTQLGAAHELAATAVVIAVALVAERAGRSPERTAEADRAG